MGGIITALMLPLMILNTIGGIVGAIWLAFLGEWSLLGMGLLYMMAGAFLISFALLPGMLFAVPMVWAVKKNQPILATLFGLPALIWTFFVLGVSCMLVFQYMAYGNEENFIPYFLWAYAVAMAPWSYMASKEEMSEGVGHAFPLFFGQIALIAAGAVVLNAGRAVQIEEIGIWYWSILLVGLLVQMVVVALIAFQSRNARY